MQSSDQLSKRLEALQKLSAILQSGTGETPSGSLWTNAGVPPGSSVEDITAAVSAIKESLPAKLEALHTVLSLLQKKETPTAEQMSEAGLGDKKRLKDVEKEISNTKKLVSAAEKTASGGSSAKREAKLREEAKEMGMTYEEYIEYAQSMSAERKLGKTGKLRDQRKAKEENQEFYDGGYDD